jgi:outer membrane protein assembly factor BamB
LLRRSLFLLVFVLLLAGCGGAGHPTTTATAPPPKPKHRPKPKHHPAGRAVTVAVTLLDGDLGTRVGHAVVRGAGHSARTDRRGRATLVLPLRSTVTVTVSARHYGRQRLPLDPRRRNVTLRVYQPRLQWPLYGANFARTQAQTHIRLRPPFRVVWSRGINSLIEYPASVYRGVAYIGSFRGVVRAISMANGKVLWEHISRGFPLMASSPAIVGDEVVYHTMDGHVYVLNARNGHLIWSWSNGSAIESSPIVRDGIDYFGSWNGTVYALDLHRHKLRWSHGTGAKITASVSISGNTLYIGDYAGRLWALYPGTGNTRWVGQVNGKIYGAAAVSHGRVFVESSDGDTMNAFSTGGSHLWTFTAGYYVYSSPAVWSGRVFFGSYDRYFYCVSAATGRLLWKVYAGGPISGAVVVVDGIAYAGSFAHRILGVDARTGRQVLSFPHGQFVPVSGNGARLLFNAYSRIYAVEPRHRRHRRRHHG